MLSHGVAALVVSRILGHSNPGITLSIYTHATMDMQAHAASVMDAIAMPTRIDVRDLQASRKDST